MVNTGSFASSIGGSNALQQAMARRGLGVGATQQMSPMGAGDQVMPEAVPETNPQVGSMPQATPKEEDNELKIALKALGGFVQSEGKLRRDLAGMRQGGIV